MTLTKKKKETILFFCAHNDDQVIGAGGTIAKYTSEGKDVITIIFSHGENSHPWMEPQHIIPTRIKEAEACDKILGGKKIVFLDLKEGKFIDQFYEKGIQKKMLDLIKETKPSKIFCHGIDDPHPDHQAVYKIVNSLLEKIKVRSDVYSFDVWTLINLRKRNSPMMVVDVSKTFNKKIKAFKVHKSQEMTILTLLWSVYLRAFMYGVNNGYKFAEVFYKIK